MEVNRSDRACNLCRQRRVRCDKSLPTCRRCSKYGQPCPGYPFRQRFIDQSDLIRSRLVDDVQDVAHKSVISPNSSPKVAGRNASFDTRSRIEVSADNSDFHRIPELKSSISASDNAATSNSAILYIPSQNTIETNASQPTSFAFPTQSPPEQLLPNVSMQQLLEDSGSDFFDLDIDTYYANETNTCGFFPGVPAALPQNNEIDMLDIMDDSTSLSSGPATSAGYQYRSYSDSYAADSSKKELALLVHLFVEVLAPWMDLFDVNAYFTQVLPHSATLNTLLQSALAAVAAKQTARHVMNGYARTKSKTYACIMANFQYVSSQEWFYKAACYYDRGISHLRARLQQSSLFITGATGYEAGTPAPAINHNEPPLRSNSQDSIRRGSKQNEIQHLFSAISVFSMYESLDDSSAIGSQHLPGFLALFERTLSLTIPQSLSAGRASFWYFARKEALSSYAHHVKPRIDPNNQMIWVSAGIPSGLYKYLSLDSITSPKPNVQDCLDENSESMPCTLIWLLTKVIDLVVSAEGGSNTSSPYWRDGAVYDTSPPDYHGNNQVPSSQHTWNKLRELLQHWYKNRSTSLMPHAVVEISSPYGHISTKPLQTAFFTCPIAAAALQLYHFIQIILLINPPTSRQDHGTRLRMLKGNTTEVEYHSREICAIALGCEPLAIQRQMSHPLQLASAYFDSKDERDTICELLREIAIETDSPIEVPT